MLMVSPRSASDAHLPEGADECRESSVVLHITAGHVLCFHDKKIVRSEVPMLAVLLTRPHSRPPSSALLHKMHCLICSYTIYFVGRLLTLPNNATPNLCFYLSWLLMSTVTWAHKRGKAEDGVSV